MKMNPGMAFGTGTHETTSMCIEALQGIVAEGDEILDIGCGSGILSVTALLCGAKHADATDIDLNAVNVAYENAELNGVRDMRLCKRPCSSLRLFCRFGYNFRTS